MVRNVAASDIHAWHHDEKRTLVVWLRHRVLAFVVQCAADWWAYVQLSLMVHEVLLDTPKHGVVRHRSQRHDDAERLRGSGPHLGRGAVGGVVRWFVVDTNFIC